jgi:hypothetical protein
LRVKNMEKENWNKKSFDEAFSEMGSQAESPDRSHGFDSCPPHHSHSFLLGEFLYKQSMYIVLLWY